MRGLLCGTNAKTNEEYREVIKKRMRLMILLAIIGVITAAIGFAAEIWIDVPISEHMLGVYSGVGTGLLAAGIILWIKNKSMLNNEQKLKESRLNNTDERIREISGKAFRAATYLMIAAMYAIALIGGLFDPILVKTLLLTVCLFLLAYVIAYKHYSNKM